MRSFKDIQQSKQDLSSLVVKRENLITEYYHHLSTKNNQEHGDTKKVISLNVFQDYFKIKNLAQIPNFREFQPTYLKRILEDADVEETNQPLKKRKVTVLKSQETHLNEQKVNETQRSATLKNADADNLSFDNNAPIRNVVPTPVSSHSVLKKSLEKIFPTGTDLQKANINGNYHHDPLNATDSVILMMDNRIPSKISASRLLIELRYLANTLPLHKLLPGAHKALTTADWNAGLLENRLSVVGSRIEELKRNGMWSLKQPKRFVDPINQVFNKNKSKAGTLRTSHGNLLEEAKWMQTDFREYKKFKLAQCALIAHAVLDYWTLGKDLCCVKVWPAKTAEFQETPVNFISGTNEQTLAGESISENPNVNYKPIFKYQLYQDEEEYSKVEKTVIENLSLYVPFGEEETLSLEQEKEFIPASKLAYPVDNDHFAKLVEKDIIDTDMSLTSLSKKRGLFGGTNRRAHYVKPPQPPPLELLEHRTPTLWLPSDDEKLVSFINLYRFNWDIVSAHMTKNTTNGYLSTMDRRSPWNCFERYVQLNEKFNINDLKGYRANIAHHWMVQAHKVQNKLRRRISPLGITEDSVQRGHRRLRWASLFEAMKRVMRRREHLLRVQSQQPPPRHAAETTTQPTPTPQQMANLKAQRDEALRKEIIAKRLNKQKLLEKQQQQQQIMQHQQEQQQKQQKQQLQQLQLQQQLQKQQLQHAQQLQNQRQSLMAQSSTQSLDGGKRQNIAASQIDRSSLKQGSPQTQNYLVNSSPPPASSTITRSASPSIVPSSDLIIKNRKNIIESYAKKYMTQKTGATLAEATQAAESYFIAVVKQQKKREAELLANQRTQILESQNNNVQGKSNTKAQGQNNVPVTDSQINQRNTATHTPTPQELLQKFQDQRNEQNNSKE
ncbi:hypothetical protein ACO0RG_004083 [Hanseniaspora osmophila]